MGMNATCQSCSSQSQCGKGCPAAVITAGGKIGDLDVEVCPSPSVSQFVPSPTKRTSPTSGIEDAIA